MREGRFIIDVLGQGMAKLQTLSCERCSSVGCICRSFYIGDSDIHAGEGVRIKKESGVLSEEEYRIVGIFPGGDPAGHKANKYWSYRLDYPAAAICPRGEFRREQLEPTGNRYSIDDLVESLQRLSPVR